MNKSINNHVTELKAVLLKLPATGENGFEGLIGVILREISGVPFRLAGSGLQFGIDGKSAYEGDAVSFEGKRYDGLVPRSEVLSKIAELSISETETDLWILGSTSQIISQTADAARKLGNNQGIAILILDWSETDLPPLAVAMAMGGKHVQEFLESNIIDDKTTKKALGALKAIRNSPDFTAHADRIQTQCNEPAMGMALAKRANTQWMSDAFSNRKRAKMKFGQPLSPGDTDRVNIRQRKTLSDVLHPYFTTTLDERVVCILGGEGNGKSWIVAQSWLNLANKPLMVFMNPDDFPETSGQNDFVDLIIAKLIKQTSDVRTDVTRERWHRRLRQWRNQQATDSPRLIVVIDGINQRPKSDWARIIESIGDELNRIGGRLIVTSRTPYFQDHVKSRLLLPFIEIPVPVWTELERNEILTEHGIKASELHRAVAASLRNPRLLGIALELLDKTDITNFEELSVSRLLFEHMRMSERDAPMPQPAKEFAKRLQEHANEIISRVKAKQQDDLNIFEDEMRSVADGRFYQSVDGDPTRYSLKDDGLTLALGFAMIDLLRKAKRNSHNLDAELDAILEPIAALDDTANVILAALTVTAADKSYEQDIAASLIKGFAALQNPDPTNFHAFASLAKSRPQGFMDAARELCLDVSYQPNFDWVQNAVIKAGMNNRTWQEMVDNVHLWLSVYSRSPDRGIFQHPDPKHQKIIKAQREKNLKKINDKLQALSENERAILGDLTEEKGDLSSLSHFALLLLAGKSLVPFVRSLLNWSFSNALNSDHAAPYKEFIHLVSLNRVDWSQTRAALLGVSNELREEEVSMTGKWTLVKILQATGHSDDGKEALAFVEDLTKDWPHFESWRLIEDYCATDPCDPVSEQPENVKRTAEKYAAIDVRKLREFSVQRSEDLFFSKARPGIARFKPEVAVTKHREFAVDVINRTGFSQRQGLFELRQHNALLTIKEARELVKKRDKAKTTETADGLSEQDAWIVSQYHLLLSFPFLSAQEQTEILLSNNTDERILYDLMYLAKPLNESDFESLLEEACGDNNERKQYLLLELAKFTSNKISTNARTHIATLSRSKSERVRIQALGVIAQSGDKELLIHVAKSKWNAANIETEDGFEIWYGSIALLEAAARGLIVHDEVLNRISARLYGRAAAMLDADTVSHIAQRIDVSINHVTGMGGDIVAPDIELRVNPLTPNEPNRFSVSERLSETKDFKEAMSQLSESNDAFEQRQKHNYEAFIKFEANLTQMKARIILDHIKLEEFETVVTTAEDLADRWYRLFMSIAKAKLPAVHNLIILLAYAIGRKAPDKTERLFCLVKDNKPLVRFTFGGAGVQLDAMATWAGVRSPILDNLCFARLDGVGTDHDLSLEVLAALLNNKQELLTAYIEEKLNKEEPAEISRGIMVAGFSDQSEFNEKILKRYECSEGLIGSSQKAARYAYERNVWAMHWFEKMCNTDECTDFWRYTVLFLKIVDGRFAVWRSNYTPKGSPILTFGFTIDDGLKKRFAKWEKHRKKKLFGSDAPTSIFLDASD